MGSSLGDRVTWLEVRRFSLATAGSASIYRSMLEHACRQFRALTSFSVLLAMNFAASGVTFAQPEAAGRHDHDHDHDHGTGEHEHHLEIGIAPGLVYLVSEREFTAGLHMHIIGGLSGTDFGFGGGIERLFDDHRHTTLSAIVQYRIIEAWSVMVTIEDAEPSEVAPSMHLETTYEFMLGRVHFGPSLEFAIDPEDVHITLGAHVGLAL